MLCPRSIPGRRWSAAAGAGVVAALPDRPGSLKGALPCHPQSGCNSCCLLLDSTTRHNTWLKLRPRAQPKVQLTPKKPCLRSSNRRPYLMQTFERVGIITGLISAAKSLQHEALNGYAALLCKPSALSLAVWPVPFGAHQIKGEGASALLLPLLI